MLGFGATYIRDLTVFSFSSPGVWQPWHSAGSAEVCSHLQRGGRHRPTGSVVLGSHGGVHQHRTLTLPEICLGTDATTKDDRRLPWQRFRASGMWLTPSHYLNQCWLIITEIFWYSLEDNCTGNAQYVHVYVSLIEFETLGHQWLNSQHD